VNLARRAQAIFERQLGAQHAQVAAMQAIQAHRPAVASQDQWLPLLGHVLVIESTQSPPGLPARQQIEPSCWFAPTWATMEATRAVLCLEVEAQGADGRERLLLAGYSRPPVAIEADPILEESRSSMSAERTL
jgi:hypothetical protein